MVKSIMPTNYNKYLLVKRKSSDKRRPAFRKASIHQIIIIIIIIIFVFLARVLYA